MMKFKLGVTLLLTLLLYPSLQAQQRAMVQVAWGTKDARYATDKVPAPLYSTAVLKGWRGERVHTQAVVWCEETISNLHVEFSLFTNERKETLPAHCLTACLEGYVMTDQLNLDGKGGCGARPDHSIFDSLMVADRLDQQLPSVELAPHSLQPIWVSCQIPRDATPGTYNGTLLVKNGELVLKKLPLRIVVQKRMLPAPHDWAFHLDLWQNPYAVSRMENVPVWSAEHLEAMRPLMKLLADAGQKVITASITHKPWNGQTEDPFESMVTWIRRVDGRWEFHYDIFDTWVEFMMSMGIDRQINCYSMVPWRLSFQFFDQRTNRMQEIQCVPGSAEYDEMWTAMLKDFARHLKEKGWFTRCTIAMDERPSEVMQKAITVIHGADPEFKISLAGNYHAELAEKLYDYCIAFGQTFPSEIKAQRDANGLVSTLYTSCSDSWPNTFTFSDPAEAAWIGFYIAKMNLNGYLRWAYNSWTAHPMEDSRFRTWAAGDTYLVYPGARSSIRFERLVEGIQNWEKIRILREEFTQKQDQKNLNKLDQMLQLFDLRKLPEIPAQETVNQAERILQDF